MSKLGKDLGMTVHAMPKPDPRLPIPDAKIGIEVEVEKWDGKNGLEFWDDKEDGSLHDKGREFVTDGPVIGEQIIKAVEEICAHCIKYKYSDGYPRAGIHIHVDMTDLDTKRRELARFVANYMLLEDALFKYAGAYRDTVGYCVSYASGQIDFPALGNALFSKTKISTRNFANLSKYQALNLKPLSDLGTVEFRHLPTTFDRTKLLNWIFIILAIKRSAIEDVGDNFEILQKFSNAGPMEYARQILGDQFYLLRDHIDPNKMWDAADNALAIMSAGQHVKLEASWEKEDNGKVNPLIAKKLEMLLKPKKEAPVVKKKSAIEAFAEQQAQMQAAVPQWYGR